MGWTSGYPSRRAAIAGEGLEVDEVNVLRAAWVGNHYWFIHASGDDVALPWIGLALLVRHGPGNWAVKVIDEASGPCYYTCPKSILEAAPEPLHQEDPFGYAKQWRKDCAQAIERRAERRKHRLRRCGAR
jgi:hypothetical protein